MDWDAVFSTPEGDICKCVVHASDGGFVLSGFSVISGDFTGQNSLMCIATPNPFRSSNNKLHASSDETSDLRKDRQ